jgi:hypothetical protein
LSHALGFQTDGKALKVLDGAVTYAGREAADLKTAAKCSAVAGRIGPVTGLANPRDQFESPVVLGRESMSVPAAFVNNSMGRLGGLLQNCHDFEWSLTLPECNVAQ